MRRMANTLVHSLRDQVRGVRYSIRAEAQTPGSAFPIVHQALDFGPLAMVNSMIGTPAIKLADGLFSHVEHVASDLMQKVDGRAETAFPCPIGDFFSHDGEPERRDFASTAHREVSRMLRGYGAQNMLVSEHALDSAWRQVLARHGDLVWSAVHRRGRPHDDAQVLACASLSVEFARARPIQRVDLLRDRRDGPRHLMLAPNLYCGLVIGLALAICSVKQEEDSSVVMESADATVDARFERLKRASEGRTAAQAVADEFKAVLPYLP
jgi:hypothetical protein